MYYKAHHLIYNIDPTSMSRPIDSLHALNYNFLNDYYLALKIKRQRTLWGEIIPVSEAD
jgi:hypothetical protein